MRMQTNLVRRGSQYYFRRKVPSDLQQHYPRADIRESLRTTDKAEAIERAKARVSHWDAVFAKHRAALIPTPARPLTQDIADAIAGALVGHILAADDEQRLEGMTDEDFAARSVQLQADLDASRRGYSHGDSSSIDGQLDDWLGHFNVTADHASDAFKKLRRDFLAARLEAQQGMLKRDAGELVRTPSRAATADALEAPLEAPKATAGAVSLSSLLDAWVTEKQPALKTIQMAKAGVLEFETIVGQKDVARLTPHDGVKYKDALIAKHPTRTTALRKFMTTSAILRLAKRNHRIAANVLDGLTIDLLEGADTRVEFPTDALKALFTSPVFTEGKRPAAGKGEAAKWLPLIALYAGMRQAEIGQLFADDIKLKDGIHYFDINRERGKTVKNRGSIRAVPIHPELVRLGLLEYAKKQKGGRLFPLLTEDTHGSLTGSWSHWFGRYLRSTVGVTDERIVFHSLRHNFKTACRDAGIAKEVHDAITGHSEGDSAEGYGEVSLKLKQQGIEKVCYPQLA